MKYLKYFLFIALVGIASCSDPELKELDFFEVSTSQPQPDLDLGRVQLRGVLSKLTSSSVEDHGFIWSTSLEELVENPEGARRQSLGVKSDNGAFEWLTPPLSLDSLYYFKAYASSGERIMYGQSTAFLWGVNVGINEVSRKNDTLNLSGFISGLEQEARRAQVSDYGIAYSSVHQEPLITQDDTVSLGARNFDGAFQAKLGALEFNTTYFLRFYMKTQLGIYYDTIVTYRVTDGWKRLGFINQPLTRATVAYTADKAYLGWGCTAKTGNCPAGNANPGFQLIQDPLGIWESLPAIPDIISGNNARVGAKAFIINDKLYAGSGTYYDNSINQYALDLIQYTPQTGQWAEIPDGFPYECVDAVAFTIGGKAYFGLGNQNSNLFAQFHEFDPTRPTFQKWKAMASLNTALTQAAGFSIATKGYVVGGLAPGLETTRRCWEFSPPDASNPEGLWTELPPMEGVPRYGAVAFVIGNKAYVGLGENPYGELADFWEFDPSKPNDPWRQVTSFPGKPRGRAAAFAVNGLGYIVGGDGRDLGNNAFIPRTDSDVWVYYPETN